MNLTACQIILFDIDGTLFNTKQFYSNFYNEIAQRYHIQLADVMRAKDNYFKTLKDRTDFNYQVFVIDIAHNLNLRIEDLKSYFLDESEYRKCIYSDVMACLGRLQTTHRLGIFSQGNKDYQMMKLTKTGILEFLDQQLVLVFDRKLNDTSINLIPPLSLIIDDKPENVSVLIDKKIDAIYLDRQGISDETSRSITSLSDLVI